MSETRVLSSLAAASSAIAAMRGRNFLICSWASRTFFPAAMAAILLGRDLIIHEQNSVMSRTNRILARFATLVAQSFRQVKNVPAEANTILTGMPIRESIANWQKAYVLFLEKTLY